MIDYLPRRPIVDASGEKRTNSIVQRNIPTVLRPGLHHQEREILNDATPTQCLPRCPFDLDQRDSGSTSHKTARLTMRSPDIEREKNVHQPGPLINTWVSDSSVQNRIDNWTSSLQSIATTINHGNSQIRNSGLEKADQLDLGSISRPIVVDIPQTVGRKQHSDSGTNMLHYNVNRRLLPGLGSSLSRLEDRGTLEQRRQINSHQSFGTQGGLLRHSVIYERSFTNRESHSPING